MIKEPNYFFFCLQVCFEAMPRQNDAWDHWYEDKGMVPNRSQKQVKCRFCPHIMSYRGDRMLAHLDYRLDLGASRDVSICRMVPPHIRVLFEECAGVVPEPMGIATKDPHVEHGVPLEPILSQSINKEREPLQMSKKLLLGPIQGYRIRLPRNYDNLTFLKDSMHQQNNTLIMCGQQSFTKLSSHSTL